MKKIFFIDDWGFYDLKHYRQLKGLIKKALDCPFCPVSIDALGDLRICKDRLIPIQLDDDIGLKLRVLRRFVSRY